MGCRCSRDQEPLSSEHGVRVSTGDSDSAKAERAKVRHCAFEFNGVARPLRSGKGNGAIRAVPIARAELRWRAGACIGAHSANHNKGAN